MASFLDLAGSLEPLANIFVFFLVLIAVWAVLQYLKLFGSGSSNEWVNAVIAFLIAIFVATSSLATEVVKNVAPWFAVLFIFIILISIAVKMVGGADSINTPGMKNLFFMVLLIIVVIGAATTIRSNVVVPGDNETDSDFDRDYSQTSTVFFHPKFLGIILVFAVAIFTVALLASSKT